MTLGRMSASRLHLCLVSHWITDILVGCRTNLQISEEEPTVHPIATQKGRPGAHSRLILPCAIDRVAYRGRRVCCVETTIVRFPCDLYITGALEVKVRREDNGNLIAVVRGHLNVCHGRRVRCCSTGRRRSMFGIAVIVHVADKVSLHALRLDHLCCVSLLDVNVRVAAGCECSCCC